MFDFFPFKLVRKNYADARDILISRLRKRIEHLEWQLAKYERPRDPETGRFISDREGLIRMLEDRHD